MIRKLRIAMALLVAATLLIALLWNSSIGLSLRVIRPEQRQQESVSSEGVVVVDGESAPGAAAANQGRTGEAATSGRVLEEGSRNPVQGAHVYRVVPGSAFVEGPSVATTDESGRFDVPMPMPSTIHVVARGFRSAAMTVTAGDSDVIVLLSRGLTISGRVVSAYGNAIGGARVWAHRPNNVVAWPNVEDRFPLRPPSGNAARAGSRGEFELSGLAPGEYVVRARQDGYSQQDWHAPPVLEAGTAGATITMAPIVGIEVVAKDAVTGAPIRGVRIGFQATKNLQMTGDLVRGEAVPRKAPAGAGNDGVTRVYFAKPGREAASVRLLCEAAGYRHQSEVVELTSRFTREEVLLHPVRAGRPGKLVLSARFAGSKEPFTGWLSLWLRSGGGTGTRIVEFVDGKATEAEVLPPGPYRYRVGGAGDVGFWWSDAVSPGTMEILEESRTALDLELRGTLVDLQVVDAEGKPVRGYDLVVNPDAGGSSGLVARWDTPASHVECFRWRSGYRGPDLILPPGKVRVGAWMAGVGRALAVVDLDGNGERITLRLPLKPEG